MYAVRFIYTAYESILDITINERVAIHFFYAFIPVTRNNYWLQCSNSFRKPALFVRGLSVHNSIRSKRNYELNCEANKINIAGAQNK